MPTSSQALLLNKERDQRGFTTPETSNSSSQRSLKPCPVSSIDINEMLPDLVKENIIIDAFPDLEKKRSSKRIQSGLKISEYDTMLSYNPVSDSFAWKFLSDKGSSGCVIGNAVTLKPAKSENETAEADIPRPKTADVSSGGGGKNVTFAKPLHYSCISKGENLACFGLQMPTRKETNTSYVNAEGKIWSLRTNTVGCRKNDKSCNVSPDYSHGMSEQCDRHILLTRKR